MGSFSFGQNFFESEELGYDEPTGSNSMFQNHSEYDEPDQGLDALGNPGEEVPINNWIFLLPLAGVVVGFYYLNKKSKMV